MSLNDEMTGLMNASRHVYGGNDKRSIADLTALMTSPSSAYIITDSSVTEESYQGITTSSVDGAILITSYDNSGNNRIMLSVGNNANVSDQMTFIMVARRSPKAGASIIQMRIGGYDATTDLTISTTDWKLYRVPLQTSASPYCSIYIDQEGPAIEYRYFALIEVGGGVKLSYLLLGRFYFLLGGAWYEY